MNPLFVLFYNLSNELEKHFHIQWIKVRQISENLLSGYGFYKRPDVKIWIQDFINLRVSTNPKSYEIECSNESLYAQICQLFPIFTFRNYQLYVDLFKELISDWEMEGK